jgi:signal transduction histidine kinase
MRRPVPLALFVLAALLGLTAVAALFSARQVDRREDQLAGQEARRAAERVDRRIDAYVEKLVSTRAFIATRRGPITPRVFSEFISSQRVPERYPGIQAFGVGLATDRAGRPALLAEAGAAARRSGQPYPPIRLTPPGDRPESVVVTAIDPIRGNERAFGLDFLATAVRAEAVVRARDTTRPAATAPLRLVQDTGNQRGFTIMLPLYAGSDQAPSAGRRAPRFRGVVYAAFRTADLLEGVLGLRSDIDLEIYDLGPSERTALPLTADNATYDLTGGLDALGERPEASRLLDLRTAGRRWKLYVAPTEPLVGAFERRAPLLIAGLGLLVSLLAAGVVYATATARSRAVALAERMTGDLRDSRNELAHRNDELEQFAFLASHDLQQPLRTVSGFLQLLERQHGATLDGRAREYVDRALSGTKDMARLIDDLLAYSRAGRDAPTLVPVRLDEVLDAAVAQLGAAIDESGAVVERGALPVVAGDPGHLTQVFANLVGNAIKYRAGAAPVVRVDAVSGDGVWDVAVTDNGVGIDPRDHQRIFGMFRRVDQSDGVDGSGVGLAIVKKLVERGGGSIRVESARGAGARFVVTLPAAVVAVPRMRAGAAA